MIHLKLLSGDVTTEEVNGEDIMVSALKDRLNHPFPIFFLGERRLDQDDRIPVGETVSVVFQSYRTYFVWSGGENSVWPGDFEKIYYYDFTDKTTAEWDHSRITENDAVMADYLSFGLFQPYNEEIKSILHLDFLPIDLDFQTLQNIFKWRERAESDTRRLEFLEFIADYSDSIVQWTKLVWLFRVTDGHARTPLQWMERLTE